MAIPKIIHQFWSIEGPPMPAWMQGFPAQWREMNPGWEYRLWTEDSLPELANQLLFNQAKHFVPERNIPQFRADLVRYELLYQFGGVWVDSDFEPLQPFEAWPVDWDGQVPFATWEEEDRWVANAMLGAAPGDPFIEILIDALPVSVTSNVGGRPAVSSGPQFVTHQYRRVSPEALQVLPQRLFYPYSYRDLGTARAQGPWPEDCLAAHHWNNQRKRQRAARRQR